ncbi:MAG: hypothetical protein CVU40_17235 [Chloroflexi bacterium HGW-Chloroflexi-2]|jgi:hypothetical protein|nr:MAG: hypothetical protein CVU40_17235 [Chloroflexi bacterium HGW-Chloroflexi-2]
MDNFFGGLENFINNWDDRVSIEESKNKNPTYVKGKEGAINLNGELSCLEASIFTKNNKFLKEAIEKGVKSLVLYLIYSLDLITYSSCEGHLIDKEKKLIKYRNVGILPRNQEEYDKLEKKFTLIGDRVNKSMDDYCVEIFIDKTFVTSETLIMPCIDIFFLPKQGYENYYFIFLEEIYQKFLEISYLEFRLWGVKNNV